jgi:hypothetical protein
LRKYLGLKLTKVKRPKLKRLIAPLPRPKIINPKHKKKNVENFGFKFNGSSELQETLGIFLILRNIFNKLLLLIVKVY